MKFIVQRVSSAACRVDDEVTGSIQKGFMVLIGISDSDTKEIADKMIKKLIGLRIFEDSEGKTNLSLKDVNGSLLLISQFTLYADCRKGNRPSAISLNPSVRPIVAEAPVDPSITSTLTSLMPFASVYAFNHSPAARPSVLKLEPTHETYLSESSIVRSMTITGIPASSHSVSTVSHPVDTIGSMMI